MINHINSILKTAESAFVGSKNSSLDVISENSPKNVKDFKSLLFAATPPRGKNDEEIRNKIGSLIQSMLSSNERERREAIWGLAYIGRPAVPYLVKILNEKESKNFFIKILSSEKYLRSGVISALIEMGPEAKDAVGALTNVIKNSKDAFLREIAVVAISKIGSAAKPAVPDLAKILLNKNEDKNLRKILLQAFGVMGPAAKEAIPAIKEMLKIKDDNFHIESAWALSCIDPALSKHMLGPLKKEVESGNYQLTAALAIINMDKNYKPARDILIKALRESDPVTRLVCAEELIKINSSAKEEALNTVIGLLDNKNADIRKEAVKLLIKLKPFSKNAVSSLINIKLNDDYKFIRNLAGNVLKKIESSPREAIPVFFDVQLMCINWEVTNGAREEMVKIGKPAVPYLAKKLKMPDTASRVCAAETLSKMGKGAQGALDELIGALNYDKYSNPSSRQYAIEALGNIGKPAVKAVNKITRVVNNRDEFIDTRIAGVHVLAKIVPNETLTEDIAVALFSIIINNPKENDELKDAIREVLKKWRRSL